MICNRCGRPMVDQFSIRTLEHRYECPNCDYVNMTNDVNETPAPNFTSMNGNDFAKHAVEEQMFARPEDCIKEFKSDYNPFKELREEFEQNVSTYRNDKYALVDILSSTVNLLLRTLEVTHEYRG